MRPVSTAKMRESIGGLDCRLCGTSIEWRIRSASRSPRSQLSVNELTVTLLLSASAALATSAAVKKASGLHIPNSEYQSKR